MKKYIIGYLRFMSKNLVFLFIIIITNLFVDMNDGVFFNPYVELNFCLFILTTFAYIHTVYVNKISKIEMDKLIKKENFDILHDEKLLKKHDIDIDTVLKIKSIGLKSKKYRFYDC